MVPFIKNVQRRQIHMSGECVISLVLSHHSKNLKQQTSVAAWLQLSFIWQAKENTCSRCEGRPTQKKSGARFWLLFLYAFFSSPEPVLCKLDQPGGLFVSPEVLTPVLGPSFVPFSWISPFFVLQPLPFWTPFFYSNYLTFPHQEMKGPILWEQGRLGLPGYFLAELGQREALGLPLLLVSSLRVLIVVS